jgi:hypothetical protein
MKNIRTNHGVSRWMMSAALAGSLLIATSIVAQPPAGRGGRGGRGGPPGEGPNPEQMIERRVAHLTEALTLSESQATELRTVLTEEHAKLAALRAETTERIGSLLSAEQNAKYSELEQRGPGGRGGRGGRGGPGGPGGGRGFRGPPPPPPSR